MIDHDASKSISGLMSSIVIAQKKNISTINKKPIQIQYLKSTDNDWRKVFNEFEKNKYTFSTLKKLKDYCLPFYSNHFTYIGSEI